MSLVTCFQSEVSNIGFLKADFFWMGWVVFPVSSRCQCFTHVLVWGGGLSAVSRICISVSHLSGKLGIIWTGRDVGDHLSQSFRFAGEETGLDGKWLVQGHAVSVRLEPRCFLSKRLVRGSPQDQREERCVVQCGSFILEKGKQMQLGLLG